MLAPTGSYCLIQRKAQRSWLLGHACLHALMYNPRIKLSRRKPLIPKMEFHDT